MAASPSAAATIELGSGDRIVYDPETGDGIWLTRSPRPFNVALYQRRVELETRVLEERTWAPRLEYFFTDFGTSLSKKMQSRSRRLRKHEVRKTDIEVSKREATKRANAMLRDVFSPEEFREEFVRIVAPLYDETILTAIESTGVSLALDFDVAARPSVRGFVTRRANQLAGQVRRTTYKQVQRQLVEGIARGEGIPDLASRVQSKMQQTSKMRATRIARTETMSAYNGGVRATSDELPTSVAAGLVWITAIDDRTRLAHIEADGMTVARGEKFIVGGEEMSYPGDPDASGPNTVNCRCTHAILTPNDMMGRVSAAAVQSALTRTALEGLSFREALREMRTSQEG